MSKYYPPQGPDSTFMSTSVRSFPMSMSDKSALNREEIIVKDEELTCDEQIHNLAVFCWNPKFREVCGRDGLNWAKIACYYFVWLMFLAGLFGSHTAIFMAIVDKRILTYRGTSNAMALDTGVPTPGLGFRPQINVQQTLIRFRSSHRDSMPDGRILGWGPYKEQLDTFLSYYTEQDPQYQQAIDCNGKSMEYLLPQFRQGKSCRFTYPNDFNNKITPCIKERNYDYNFGKPCVLIKLNKIYDWEPITYRNAAEVPDKLKSLWQAEFGDFILVVCDGENDVDRDFLYEVEYFSQLNTTKIGGFHRNYFPYLNQDGYRSPLVFVYFKRIETNVLINVECKAYARNIDHKDSIEYKRGSVHFELIVE